jgi:hypothetical protein
VFFMIVGARPHKRSVDSPRHQILWCPSCGSNQSFEEKSVRNYFELFFIPLFPLGSGRRVLSCHVCGFDVPAEQARFFRGMGAPGTGERSGRGGDPGPVEAEVEPVDASGFRGRGEEAPSASGRSGSGEGRSAASGRGKPPGADPSSWDGEPVQLYCVHCGAKVPARSKGLQYLQCPVCRRRFEVNI